ncbi:hypothetical protein K1719_043756 [Acacia pycnantha]|nr:hypothetical protein K1719_043756 [Acacia pycnantha]
MEDSQKAKFHMWTVDEDKVLFECLVQLRTEQKFMADKGFKSGYATRLEAMMEEHTPDSKIKGNPHIISRIKTMKLAWQVVYDMAVWDEYVKVHKKTTSYRNKCLPHFQDLCLVWSKDRAGGDWCKSPLGMEEEIHEEQEEIPESPINLNDVPNPAEIHDPHFANDANGTRSECSGNGNKRRKLGKSDMVVEVLRKAVSSLDRTV